MFSISKVNIYWQNNKIKGKNILQLLYLMMVNLYGVDIYRRKNKFAECERRTSDLALT